MLTKSTHCLEAKKRFWVYGIHCFLVQSFLSLVKDICTVLSVTHGAMKQVVFQQDTFEFKKAKQWAYIFLKTGFSQFDRCWVTRGVPLHAGTFAVGAILVNAIFMYCHHGHQRFCFWFFWQIVGNNLPSFAHIHTPADVKLSKNTISSCSICYVVTVTLFSFTELVISSIAISQFWFTLFLLHFHICTLMAVFKS